MSEEMKDDSAQTDKPVPKKEAGEPLPDGSKAPIPSAEQAGKSAYNLDNLDEALHLYGEWRENSISDKDVAAVISSQIKTIAESCGVQDYLILGLFDNDKSIGDYHADWIYNGASLAKSGRDIYLLINSMGGRIEPAYLIGKTCQRFSKAKFVVGVPRKAKSAATLICLGADEIHMGMMSELGPVDPQIANRSVLGLSNALSKIAQLNAVHPETAEMFCRYLSREINLIDVGHFERIAESAKQYAVRLLNKRRTKTQSPKLPENLADHLVNHYKDHSFVIDVDEAKDDLFGEGIVKTETDEYQFANRIYVFLSRMNLWANIFKKKTIRFIGDIDSGIRILDKPKKN